MELHELLDQTGGVVRTADFRSMRNRLSGWQRSGELERLAPGILVEASRAQDFGIRCRAALGWVSDGTLVGQTAAAVMGLMPPGDVCVATAGRQRSIPGIRVVERVITPDWRTELDGLRLTSPALTAVDLCDGDGGDLIDTMLRRRMATVDQIECALSTFGGRRGNAARRRVVARSRTEPWSQAERLLHTILDEAGLTGWVANRRLVLSGQAIHPDVMFPGARLVVEADGQKFHGPEAFESDRERQNVLVLHGWRVLRYSWRMLQDRERVVADIRRMLRGRPVTDWQLDAQ